MAGTSVLRSENPVSNKEEAAMGVLDYMYDNDWIQRSDINNLQRSNMVLRNKMVRDGGRIRDLEQEIDHLTLINEALLRMLEKKGGILRAEFRALLVEA